MLYIRINRITPLSTYSSFVHSQIVTIRVFTPAGPRASRKSTKRKPLV